MAPLLLILCAFSAVAAELTVTVKTGANPVPGMRVTLFRAGASKGAPAEALRMDVADVSGVARIAYTPPEPANTLYVLADGPAGSPVRLANVLGATAVAPREVVVNEITTVATAYAMAQFLKGGDIAGVAVSLQTASAAFSSLVNPATGNVSPFFGQTTIAQIHTLANLLASCVQSREPDACRDLFHESKAPGFGTPANTLDAAVSIARSPANNVVPLYHLAPRNRPYSPALTGSPESWVLALRHAAAASLSTPSIQAAIDPAGNRWVTDAQANSVFQFDPSGKLLSPPGGFRDKRIRKPQGVRSDACGNIWIANSGGGSVTKFPQGDASRAVTFEIDIREPFAVAIDDGGNAWITGIGNDRVAKLGRDGKPAPGSPFIVKGLDRPVGIAVDPFGNAWVANQSSRTITMFRPDALETRNFTGGGLDGPSGIAVDGNGNVFAANSKRPSLSVFCGAKPETCPPGKQTGDAISPAPGYASNGVTHLGAVAIDAAGNVWVAGGDGVAEFVGMATPVASPLIGPPRQPGQVLPACTSR